MPFVQAKCPECGGILAVEDNKKAANCQFCGNAFIVEEAVNNYITNNITNNTTNHNYGEGAVVNVYEHKPKDFVIEGGVLKKYKGESLTPVIPEGVVAIAGGVFKNSMITAVTFPSTLKELQFIEKDDEAIGPFYGCKYLKEIILPEGLKKISAGAFSECESLVSVIIPNSVTSIGEDAFWECTSLASITFPNYIKRIEPWTFCGCTNLESITIPNSVTSIGDHAFCDCTSLTTITIPNSVREIGDSAFYACKSFTTITIPNSVTSIGDHAFCDCTSLTTITIPNSVREIGDSAFYACKSLTTITIPDSVTSIGGSAFSGCTSLTSVTIPKNVKIDVFYNTPWYDEQKKIVYEQERIANKQKIIDERKRLGVCTHCGGIFVRSLFSTKCFTCGRKKDY